jgi:hypothetical protein
MCEMLAEVKALCADGESSVAHAMVFMTFSLS